MKQIRRLLEIVSFVLLCFVTDVNSAQVNIAGCIYKFDQVAGSLPRGPYRWHQLLENINGTHILTAENLRYHFIRIWNNQERGVTGRIIPSTSILIELARMLLAQIPAVGRVKHNVAENNSVAYMTRECVTDVYKSCGELKKHLLEHGHLGYFPMISVQDENSQVKVNKLIPRGIFCVNQAIMQRVMEAQRNALNWLNAYHNGGNDWEFFNRLPNYLSNLGFYIDPIIPFPARLAQNVFYALNVIIPRQHILHVGLNLENFTDNLINYIFTANNIQDVVIHDVENNRIGIDVTYNMRQGVNIGMDRGGNLTNTVKIVVQVQNGIISIVTMYPLG